MRHFSKHALVVTISSICLLFCFAQTSSAQVAHCTDGGCSDFEIECQQTGGDVVCLNAQSTLTQTKVDEHRCEVALAIMEKNCKKDNPQPCIIAEDRVMDRCYYMPLTLCVPNPDIVSDLLLNYPDVCVGTCDDVLNYFDDPDTYPQPMCSTDF